MTTGLHDIGVTLANLPPLRHLQRLAPADTCFLVGGALRDALLGRPVCDLDFASAVDPTPLARQFAEDHQAPWFWLDQARGQSRVLLNLDGPLTCDFAPLRAADLPADLAARDFTINSLALPLTGALHNDRLIDPLHGLDDLLASRLRRSGPQAFVADPLRIVKGLRHAVTLGFILEEETCQAMYHDAWRLGDVARERIRQEIWAILAQPAAEQGLQLLSITGAGRLFWGSEYDGKLEDIIATLRHCRIKWDNIRQSCPSAASWLDEEVEAGLTREVLLLWALLLARIEPGLPMACAEEWLFSRRAQARIGAVAALDAGSLCELDKVARRPRPLALWARQHGLDVADLLLAAAVIEVNEKTLADWIPLVEPARQCRLESLVSGAWLAGELGLRPGPEIGAALHRLRQAEITGQVADAAEARDYLRRYVQNRD